MTETPLSKFEKRENFAYFLAIQLRWDDNDAYGHINNSRYASFFDSTIMHYLSSGCGFDLKTGLVAAFTVENMCRFHQPLVFPSSIDCGLRVANLGNSSVRYELGVFPEDTETVAATGYFIDVFVDAKTEKPTAIPENIRTALANLTVNA
tara:strand:+ start:342 stop:791 length:450 start_codon:yes stop_codon:yes gene_type:complete